MAYYRIPMVVLSAALAAPAVVVITLNIVGFTAAGVAAGKHMSSNNLVCHAYLDVP